MADGGGAKVNVKHLAHILRDTFPDMKNLVTVGDEEHSLNHELRSPDHSIEAWHLNIRDPFECDITRHWPNIYKKYNSFFGKHAFDVALLPNEEINNFDPSIEYASTLPKEDGGFYVVLYSKHQPCWLPYQLAEKQTINMRRFKMFWDIPVSVYRMET